ncbi:PfkB family carbohydrate kinase [Thalassomonas sp. M1454]|uniref:PfkB family carbohydrate kinase n=1 Tax=Thalassomonas sp. M1454 TaxID=2594477 RepID=UPI001180DE9F|nr:PfkB family carbohydrate kinase [Thalassomonas sp. M1454]TRX53886.1 hypothetical protein FNN08_13090 [Thalassomonas sp. M1454]
MQVNIPNFNETRILVAGDIMVNSYDAEPVLEAAANVALNLACLGGQVSLFGITGDDEFAQGLDDKLSSTDVICHFIHNKLVSTLSNSFNLNSNPLGGTEEKHRPFTEIDKAKMLAMIEANIGQHHLVLLSDYDLGTLSDAQPVIALAHDNDIPVIVHTKSNKLSNFRGASVIVLTIDQLRNIFTETCNENELVIRAKELLTQYELNALLIYRTGQGVTLIRTNEEELHIPTITPEIFDDNGVDDALLATLACSIAAGASLVQASALANIAMDIVLAKKGAATLSEVEIAQALQSGKDCGSGIVTTEQLKTLIRQAKQLDQKVIFTKGSFDILESADASYLAKIAKLGQRLVVAVSDDESVKRIRGAGRPINHLYRRMALIAKLDCVDWVISYNEDNLQDLIANVLPDLLVEHQDINLEDVVGAESVIANGGEVQVIDFEEEPTSEIINTVRLGD